MARAHEAKKQSLGASRRKKGAHRAKPRNSQAYTWLGAGSLALGLGAAMVSGSGLAHADTSQSASPHAADAGGSGISSPQKPATVRPGSAIRHSPNAISTAATQAGARSDAYAGKRAASHEPVAITRNASKRLSTSHLEAVTTGTTSAVAAEVTGAGLLPVNPSVPAAPESAAAHISRAAPAVPRAAASIRAANSAVATAASVTSTWSPPPLASLSNVVVGLLLSLGGMNSSNPAPANPIQQFLYSIAKGLSDSFDPAPPAGTPTVGTPDPNTGAVGGSLGFPTGGDLTFTAGQPSQGMVSVADDGTYTYTPTQAARRAAGATTTDTFTATVHEGLSTNSVTVTVPVDAGTPVAGTPNVGSPDPTTGAVTGSAVFTDTAGRALTFGAPTTSSGGATVSLDASTGAYTYIPTQAQRQAATATTTDVFTVTASNGVRSASEAVTVPVLSLAAVPVAETATPAVTSVKGSAGLVINLLWDSSVSQAPSSFKPAVVQAAQIIGASVSNKITLNIAVGYGEIGGWPIPSRYGEGATDGDQLESYATVKQQLVACATTATDQSVVANLPADNPFGGLAFEVSGAQLKVFGVDPANGTSLDGEIGFATDLPNSLLVAAALHELIRCERDMTVRGVDGCAGFGVV